ncbi:hypothetical protein GGTG_07174 [Gaeumannomyces tritici R3-111a-1]|uniref:Uncharacterized protein n=1 Tax=Gaeumannomyces tritici (strain R3-111a-1) TaxID=644352 RepID=J3P0X8_GAET3|nr:hypothetical protein GGTG_07174 [Gaeumannomyces tritici R3-111a-1]EJT77262.1 hypothetical protein GGTG_07174 [Gaeumannomyces tritici R3-111a-1]
MPCLCSAACGVEGVRAWPTGPLGRIPDRISIRTPHWATGCLPLCNPKWHGGRGLECLASWQLGEPHGTKAVVAGIKASTTHPRNHIPPDIPDAKFKLCIGGLARRDYCFCHGFVSAKGGFLPSVTFLDDQVLCGLENSAMVALPARDLRKTPLRENKLGAYTHDREPNS